MVKACSEGEGEGKGGRKVSDEGEVPWVTCEARAPGIVVGCAELVSVESWRVDDAPTLPSMQKVARNLSRRVPLILVSVFWRERLSCESVPCWEGMFCYYRGVYCLCIGVCIGRWCDGAARCRCTCVEAENAARIMRAPDGQAPRACTQRRR